MAGSTAQLQSQPTVPIDVTSTLPSVTLDGITYQQVQEGKAIILVPEAKRSSSSADTGTDAKDGAQVQSVFYNPIQQFNRDLTVLAIKVFGEEYLAEKAEKTRVQKQRQGGAGGRKRKRGEEEKVVVDGSGQVGANNLQDGGRGDDAGQQSRADKMARVSRDRDGVEEGGDVQEGRGADAGGSNKNNSSSETTDAPTASALAAPESPPVLGQPNEQESVPVPALDQQQQQQQQRRPDDAQTIDKPSTQNTITEQHRLAKSPRFTILDALSATGLRALRYAHEIPFVTSVTANDITASAVEYIKLNAAHNNLSDKITTANEDALAHMYRVLVDDLSRRDMHGKPAEAHRYHVVDLDPYGTAAPFFDAAVQSVRDGGLLAVTCTDSALFAGHGYPEKTYTLYGGVPVKGMHSHEAGLRLIINAVAQAAARHQLTVEPLLSLSIDYYCRIFLRVRKSQAAAKFLGSKTMLVYGCDYGCGAWQPQYFLKHRLAPTKRGGVHHYRHSTMQGPSSDMACQHCGQRMHVAGPMYGGFLHSPEFITRLLAEVARADRTTYQTLPRIEGMLETALEEVQPPAAPGVAIDQAVDVSPFFAAVDPTPFFVIAAKLSAIVCCENPPDDMIRGALDHLGYRVLRSHCRAGSIKTDAPWTDIWWIMREWVRQRAPIKAKNIGAQHPARKILGDELMAGAGQQLDVDMGGGEEEGKEDGTIQGDGTIQADETAKGNEITEDGRTEEIQDTLEDRKRTLRFNAALQAQGARLNKRGVLRYQLNPRPNWGPMSKASGL